MAPERPNKKELAAIPIMDMVRDFYAPGTGPFILAARLLKADKGREG
jgi:hypothetical protein